MNSNDTGAALLGLLLSAGTMIFFIIYFIVLIGLSVLMFIALWKIFVKADRPGWAALVPVYNWWVVLEISLNNNILWFILMFIPGANIVSYVISLIGLCKTFKKSTVFTVLTVLLCGLTIPFLGFGKAEYHPECRL